MALRYPPRKGQIYNCDFKGFSEPEMVKKRPVVIVAPRLPHRNGLATIVPLSTTAPLHDVDYVYRLTINYHPEEDDELTCWAKADMVTTVSMKRLDAIKVGRRRYVTPQLSTEDLDGVMLAMRYGLGLID
ncbi:MAG: type II toxin-antitoxin system PemK/MazF family toxin [Hyphomicrobiales bacterium]